MIDLDLAQNTRQTEWDFGNEILYNMCENNFEHEKNDKIIGKIILIGRAYAAAIERRKNKTEDSDNFYIDKVAPKIKKSKLDYYISELKPIKTLTVERIPDVLKLHFYLTDLIKELTEQDKRSFTSKYLHFHLPNLFFIYDTRAIKAIRLLNTKLPKKYRSIVKDKSIDEEYAKFFYRCFAKKNALEKEYNVDLTIRHFDNILMKVVKLDG